MSNNHQTLRAKGLHKQYGNRWVGSDGDIEVNKGEIIGLLGPNGAGKTTTFSMITGMIKPTKGQIFLDDKEITSKAMYMRARMYIALSVISLSSRKILPLVGLIIPVII